MRLAATLFAAATLAGCATTGGVGRPTEVIRFHLGEPVARGTVVVQPADGGDGLADQPFAAAVADQLGRNGYVPAAPGGAVDFIAVVDVRHRQFDGPRRRSSGVSIGIGGGGFGGGRSGGFGLGGGVSFPVGGSRASGPEGTELSVTIKRRVDQSPVWEGQARLVENGRTPRIAVAEKLARALFTGFPGESGRTIDVP